jgi:hypothetical protein
MTRWVNWGLPAVTALTYGLLVMWFGPQVQAAAGGLMPFDLRATGYGVAEARDFLAALTPEGRALYLGPVRINDTVFPILFTLTLCLPLRGKAWVWFLPALAYGVLDLAENMAVAALLRAGPEVADSAVALASGLTMAKFAACVVAVVLALLGVWKAWRARQGGRHG